MAKWVDIAPVTEVPEGERKITQIEGTPVAVFNLSNEFYAIEDRCTHQHLPLADGFVSEDDIVCPFHGAVFSIKTGEAKSAPACVNLTTYPVRIENGIIQVEF